MAEKLFKVNQRVEVSGKDCKGVIAYFGYTLFSPGKWIGVILDEPKGKNNGTVQGKTYFQCKDNYGMFVRQSQLILLDDFDAPILDFPSPSSSTSTATTPDDPSRARSRLNRSRLPLAGSRSQSDFPTKDEMCEPSTPTTSEPTSKRASFIEKSPTTLKQSPTSAIPVALKQATQRPRSLAEPCIGEEQTGFVETLKPQYIPGPAMVSPGAANNLSTSTVEEKLNTLQQHQEIDALKAEVKDLKEKLETIKAKRLQDKEKLKDYDQVKLQLEQLLEFKSRIMESQIVLQRELQRAKQEARDAIEAKDRHAEEMADLSETVEMATLDKEMAEEKAEMLQQELEQAQEKIEEMQLDLEILKAEMTDREDGSGGTASSFEVKQLEQQNQRLRDTLVKMRDLSAHDKHEFQKLQKDFDQKKSEVAELARIKEKLSSRLEEMERQIVDLQEQVDAALGAEEMVQQLSMAKLQLEDKVVELEEAVADLEELQDMNEQVQESSRELEVELREELDLAQAATREALREKEAALETVADREQTISKFRELVQKQQEHCIMLKEQLERASQKPVSSMPEILDFKKMFNQTKAHTKAIDLELRRIDLEQANHHIKYLTAYMPDSFMARGGDYDAVLVLLLTQRMFWKVDILISHIREKFPAVENIDRAAILQGHSVEQYSFKSKLTHILYTLQMILQQFIHGLNTCTPEMLLKVGSSYMEIAGQERIVENFLDLLKKDQLDENIPLETLEKCVTFFTNMFSVLLGPEVKVNQTHLLAFCSRALSAAVDGIQIDANILKTLYQGAQDTGDMTLLFQHLSTTGDNLQQQLKQIRRRIPQENPISNLGFPDNLSVRLQECCLHALRVCKVLREMAKTAQQQVLMGDQHISREKMSEFAFVACDHVFENEDRGPIECLKTSIDAVSNEVGQLVQSLQESEYDIATYSATEEKITQPIVTRAQSVKKDLEETKSLRHKLEMKETDIKELKIALKLKHEELGEMNIRKEMAEKKLSNLNKDHELEREKLLRKLDEAQQQLKRKEKEFEESMDHLQSDIESLESEKGELKEKLKNFTKKALFEGMNKSTANPASFQASSPLPSLSSTSLQSDYYSQQIKSLKVALEMLQQENWKLRAELARNRASKLAPLQIPDFLKNKFDDKAVKKENPVDGLIRKGSILSKDIFDNLCNPQVIDFSKVKPGTKDWKEDCYISKQIIKEQARVADLLKQVAIYESEVTNMVMKHKAVKPIEADISSFLSPEMVKMLQETGPVAKVKLQVPVKKPVENPVVNMQLDADLWKHLQIKLVA